MKKQALIDAILRDLDTYIGLYEGDGPNRSVEIDSFNQFMKVPLGSPYCLSGLWYSLDNVAQIYGATKIDLPKTAHCLTFARDVKPIYKTMDPQPGDWGIYRMGDTLSGHAVCVKKRTGPAEIFTTEFNTREDSSQMIRDGDGCYPRTRPILGQGNMKLVTFVRVVDALIFPKY